MITVALPIWKMQDIIWLQLESLCRQKDAGEWELIVSECETNYVYDLIFEQYTERLHGRGCINFRVIKNRERLPLGLKWKQIAESARGDTMLLCAGDNYSPPNRIAMARGYIGEYDWFDVSSGLFYDINSGATAQWNRASPRRSGLWMATRTKYIAALNDSPPSIGIDGWIKSQVPPNMKWKQHEEPLAGLHTDGRNTISHYRAAMYREGTQGNTFSYTDKQKIEDCIPSEVLKRLCD